MKKMELTGLAEETSFAEGGEVRFLLVFNNGELRVPVSEESAKAVVEHMYSSNGYNGATEAAEDLDNYSESQGGSFVTSYERGEPEGFQDEDGIDQV